MKHGVKTVVITAVGVVGLLGIGVLIFIYAGLYSVAADQPHWRITEWLLETARTRSIASELADVSVPDELDNPDRIRRGAIAYEAMCEVCHLAPGQPATPLYRGLNPKAPKLAESDSHQHTPAYIFWVIKHGIKMTGMPAWGESHPDESLWDLVAFVEVLPELSEQDYQELTTAAGSDGHNHDHRNGHHNSRNNDNAHTNTSHNH